MIVPSYRGGRTNHYPGSWPRRLLARSVPHMLTSRLARLSLLALAAASLPGCASLHPGSSVTEERTIDDIDSVSLETSGDLTVVVGEVPALTVTAGEDVISRLGSEVDDGVLRLTMDDTPLPHGGVIRYQLTVTTLESLTVLGSGDAFVDLSAAEQPALTVRGSGDIEAKGIDAQTAELTIDGSGEILVRDASVESLTVRLEGSGGVSIGGNADAQDVEIDGDGDYRAADLRSVEARVAIRGAGDAELSVSGALDARIDGSGEIVYEGDPEVTKSISGSGEIRRR